MKYIGVLLVLLLIPFGIAQEIEYTLNDKDVFVEMRLDYEGYFNILLPSDYSSLSLSSNDYFLDSNHLVINGNGVESISFVSKSFLEKSGHDKIFISANQNHLGTDVSVILPEGSTLQKDKIIFPKDYSLSTDGERIIIEWENIGEEEILLSYSNKSNYFIYYILGALLILISAFFYFYNKRNKQNSKTKNLFREEKKIMNYLLKKKGCWTKEIVRDLDISKVKLSRKLRSLEEKGLIERIPHGNENRIKLK